MKLNNDLNRRALVHSDLLEWVASPMAGVSRRMLERDGEEVARATSVVRYAPGSAFSAHTHHGGEEFLVLEGVFADELGEFPAGMYVRNPVGSRHVPKSPVGCTIFVKLWQMPATDQAFVRVNSLDAADWIEMPSGARRLPLHQTSHETVSIIELHPGGKLALSDYRGGAELFVIEGTMSDEADAYRRGSWLRLPCGAQHQLRSNTGARVYLKTGHLSDPPPLPVDSLQRPKADATVAAGFRERN